jgi:1-acyl-sn-glycerol-3-phosphate acyltransferase
VDVPGNREVRVRSPHGRGLHAAWSRGRAAGRLAAFAGSNLLLAGLFFLLLPLTWGSAKRRGRLRDAIFRTWARVSLASAGVRVEVRGSAPSTPCYLVANHIVYLDIWILAAQTGAVFVAESGIASWPFFGAMARALSVIFVDRRNNRTIPTVNRSMEEAIARGHVVVLFPESRTSGGDRVLPFRSSLLAPAAESRRPVAWAAITYRTEPPDPPASGVLRWPDGERIVAHAARLLLLDRVTATVTFGEGTISGGERKALAASLQARVEALFTPMA